MNEAKPYIVLEWPIHVRILQNPQRKERTNLFSSEQSSIRAPGFSTEENQNAWTGKVSSIDPFIIIFHLSKLWKAKFSIQCDVIFLVRLQGKFDIDHSWEWKG